MTGALVPFSYLVLKYSSIYFFPLLEQDVLILRANLSTQKRQNSRKNFFSISNLSN